MTSEIVAVLPRNDDPDDDLVVYAEKPHKPTIDWILRITAPIRPPRPNLWRRILAKIK